MASCMNYAFPCFMEHGADARARAPRHVACDCNSVQARAEGGARGLLLDTSRRKHGSLRIMGFNERHRAASGSLK